MIIRFFVNKVHALRGAILGHPILFVIFLICFGSIINSFYITHLFGGTDLRCRIVGARLMTAGKSPYFYHWQPLDPETLLDPNYIGILRANGNVVTPAYLLLLRPLSFLSYIYIRYLWTFLQYVFLIAVLAMAYTGIEHKKTKINALALGSVLLFFVCSNIWLFNIDRGQTYILYLFFISFSYFLFVHSNKNAKFFSGFFSGLFLFVRPLLMFNSLAYLTTLNKKYIVGLITGILVGYGCFVHGKEAIWLNYFTAMKTYSLENIVNSNRNPYLKTPINYPLNVEGVYNLSTWGNNYNIASLLTLQYYARGIKLYLTPSFLIILPLFISVLLCCWFYVKKLYLSTYKVVLFGCLIYLIAELCLVGYRNNYNVIQWILPIFILLSAKKINNYITVITIFALLQLLQFPFSFPFQEFVGEGLLYCIIFYEVFFNKKLYIAKNGYKPSFESTK